MSKSIIYPPIGISGSALSGKDSLCTYIIYILDLYYNIKAKRCSIAGDKIKNDLKEMLFSKIGAEIDLNDPIQKEKVRPLMVEYGRYMRNRTMGRYFIENIDNSLFGKGYIPIIPDIRYAEFEKDEIFWLKTEKKGLLIFIDRENNPPANEFEEKNNIILKKEANIVINAPNLFSTEKYLDFMEDYVYDIITTYLRDISPLLDKS